jgi:hypothetical protein
VSESQEQEREYPMIGQTVRWPDWLFGAVLAVGTAVGALHVTLGLYPMGFAVWLMTGVGATVLALDLVPALARKFREELALVPRLSTARQPLTIQVVAATGGCVWGYHERDEWTADAEGRLTPRLCRAAVSALARAGNGNLGEQPVACQCPLAGREVSFAVRPVAAAA